MHLPKLFVLLVCLLHFLPVLSARGQRLSLPNTGHPHLKLGAVYSIEGNRCVLVAELLSHDVLDGKNAWIQTQNSNRVKKFVASSHSSTIESFNRVCVNTRHGRKYCWKRTSLPVSHLIYLQNNAAYESYVDGVHDIASIVNRPLTGRTSHRSAELRIAQIRDQLSDAIVRSETTSHTVAVCTKISVLDDLKLAYAGFGFDAVQKRANNDANKLNFSLVELHSEPSTSGEWICTLDGSVIIGAEFHFLKRGTRTAVNESAFYLGKRIAFDCQPPSF